MCGIMKKGIFFTFEFICTYRKYIFKNFYTFAYPHFNSDKLGKVGSNIRKLVLEEGGTEIDDEYLPFVKPGTILM